MHHRIGILIICLLIAPGCARPTIAAESPLKESRHIILFIADGMQLANEIALSRYLHGEDRALVWHDFEYQCYVATWDIDTYDRYARQGGKPRYSADSFDPIVGYDPSRGGIAPWPVAVAPEPGYLLNALPTWAGGRGSYAIPATDSASAATAIATGRKTDQGNISWASGDPPDGRLTTIAELMKQGGASIGVVTSVEFSHATPAPFVAHNVNRGNPGQVAHEMITETKPDVVIGAGHPDASSGYISRSDYNALKDSQEYVLVEGVKGQDGGVLLMEGAQRAVDEDRKLFGLFGGSNGCFGPPVPHDNPGNPDFDVNDENPSLADATVAALTVCSSDPDGFFLMIEQGDLDRANHYNDYYWMIGSMWDLEQAVEAAVEFVDRPNDDVDWTNTLLIVTADHATGGLRLSGTKVLGIGDLPEMVGQKYHYRFPSGEVEYLTTVHINEPVTLYGKGAGLELFEQYEGQWYPGTRIIDNTQVFKAMAEFASVNAP